MSEKTFISDTDKELISKCFDLSNLSFLTGTGFSKAFDGNSMDDVAKVLYSELLTVTSLDDPTKEWIENDLASENKNVEQFLDRLYIKKRALNDIKKEDKLNDKLIDMTRKKIFDLCRFTPTQTKIPLLFVFLNTLVNRKSGLSRVNLFTLNYDLLIDRCADELGILLNDGFDGTTTRWLNTSQFDLDFYYPSGVVGDKPVRCERVINYFKLHGSLNWQKESNRIVKGDCSYENMLIYPHMGKYETMLYDPFSEIFRRFSVSIKRPKGALIVVGYSFRDAHINQIILQALEQPFFRLIVVDPVDSIGKYFTESNRFIQRIKKINVGLEDFVKECFPQNMEEMAGKEDKIAKLFEDWVKGTQEEK